MSKFSPRRNTIKIVSCLAIIILLLLSATVHASLSGTPAHAVVPAAALAAAIIMLTILVRVSIRTVEGEIWIRRLGMGDLDYHVEPRGNDEIAKALHALEAVRQTCIRAMRLDQVQELTNQLQAKNDKLESTLEELRNTQDRTVSQQKLAELGELAAGIAHEMRNPLQFIRNFTTSSELIALELAQVLQDPARQLDQEDTAELLQDLVENMQRVNRHADRANDIINSMMTLDRGAPGQFRTFDLNQLVTDQTTLAHQAVQAQVTGFRADIVLDLDPKAREVRAIPEDLARAIAHMTTNACQAMADRAAAIDDSYTPRLRTTTRRDPDGVYITIRDNGTGITPEVQNKMFNPFFTTKETGPHTGLGLSLSHDIVREHDGTIQVNSQLLQHTELTIHLPQGAT